MCQMLSYVVDKTGKIYWITPQMRKEMWEGLKNHDEKQERWINADNIENVDSHAYICRHFGINEDSVTKLEINPFSRHIRLDTEKEAVPSRFVDGSFRVFEKILDEMSWEDLMICHLTYRGYEVAEKYKKLFEKNKGKKVVLVSKFLYTYYEGAVIESTYNMIEKLLDIKLPIKDEMFVFNKKNQEYINFYRFVEMKQYCTDRMYLSFKNEEGNYHNINLVQYLWNSKKVDPKEVLKKPVFVVIPGQEIKQGDLVRWKGTKLYHPGTFSDACQTMRIGCIRKVESLGREGCIHVFTQVNGDGDYHSSYRFSPLDFDKVDLDKSDLDKVDTKAKKTYKFKKGDVVKCIAQGCGTAREEVNKLFTIKRTRCFRMDKTQRELFMEEPREPYCQWSLEKAFVLKIKKPVKPRKPKIKLDRIFKIGDKIVANRPNPYSCTVKGNGYGIITSINDSGTLNIDWYLIGYRVAKCNYRVEPDSFDLY